MKEGSKNMNTKDIVYTLENLINRYQKEKTNCKLETYEFLAINEVLQIVKQTKKLNCKLYTISEIADMYGYKAVSFNKLLNSLKVFYTTTYQGKERYMLSKELIKKYGKDELIYQERKTLKTSKGFVDVVSKPKENTLNGLNILQENELLKYLVPLYITYGNYKHIINKRRHKKIRRRYKEIPNRFITKPNKKEKLELKRKKRRCKGYYKKGNVFILNKRDYITTLYHELGHKIYKRLRKINSQILKTKAFKDLINKERSRIINQYSCRNNKRNKKLKVRYHLKENECFARIFSIYYSKKFLSKYPTTQTIRRKELESCNFYERIEKILKVVIIELKENMDRIKKEKKEEEDIISSRIFFNRSNLYKKWQDYKKIKRKEK